MAAWALRRSESGQPPAWENYWDMPEETWQAEVMSLREQREMRYDDATLLLLRICDPRAEPPDEPPWAAADEQPRAAAESPLAPAATPAIPLSLRERVGVRGTHHRRTSLLPHNRRRRRD